MMFNMDLSIIVTTKNLQEAQDLRDSIIYKILDDSRVESIASPTPYETETD